MKVTSGACKINSVQVTHAVIEIRQLPTMTAVYGLAEAERLPTGQHTIKDIHGKCDAYHNNWSPRTLELLGDLIRSMEEDLLSSHFDVGDTEEKHERLAIGGHQETPQI